MFLSHCRRIIPVTTNVVSSGLGPLCIHFYSENLVIEKKSKKKKKEETFDASFYEEARYEKVPQGETKGTHYLLPLKADHGQLIQQEPTLLASKGEKSSVLQCNGYRSTQVILPNS